MKKIILVLMMFVLSATIVFADVTSEIIAVDRDAKSNIRVWTQYKVDGVEVVSSYPKILGKFVWATRFDAHNFAGMSDAQIELRIMREAEAQVNNLLQKEFIRKTISTNDDIFDNHLPSLIGKTVTKTTTSIRINNTTVMEVKTDGTSVQKTDTR